MPNLQKRFGKALHFALCVLMPLLVAACAPMPALVDPLDDIGTVQKTSGRVADLRTGDGQKIALIPSTNTRNLLTYLRKNEETWGNYFSLSDETNAMSAAANDGRNLAAGPVLILKKQFRNVVAARNLTDARQQGLSVAVVLDVQSSWENVEAAFITDGFANATWRYEFTFVRLAGSNEAYPPIVGLYTRKRCVIVDGGPFNPNPAAQSSLQCDLAAQKGALAELESRLHAVFGR